jgi:site-specific DNA recombinase
MRPESEWITVEKPELRIVDEPLWTRVVERLMFVGTHYNYGNRPGLAPRSHTSPNLLTGLMQCGICGANLTIVAGRGKHLHPKYGCPQNAHRGACANGLKERSDLIGERLFSELQNAVLRPEAVAYAVGEFERLLKSSLAGLDNKIGRMRQRSAEIKQEIEIAVSNLILCNNNPTLIAAINRRQEELDEITRELLNAEPDSVTAEIGRIRQFVTAQLGDIRQILQGDVQKAKAELAKHVNGIRMMPQFEGKKGHYIAEGEWDLLGGFVGLGGNQSSDNVRMVAGEGFEPSTFGL